MMYTDLTKKAMNIAYSAHNGQSDKAGIPYIFHPYSIAEQMDNETDVIIALLHDVFEDAKEIFIDQVKHTFSSDIINALNLLTYDRRDAYMDYIKKIKCSGNQHAIRVKMADLQHNSDLNRLDAIDLSEKDIQRVNKYKSAINYLTL